MKKIISVLLCIAILTASCALMANAETKENDPADYPVIMVAGYASTSFYMGDSPETGKHVWGVEIDDILSLVLERIAEVGIGIGALTLGNTKLIAHTVGQGLVDLYGDIACKPDGTSVNELHKYTVDPAEVNNAAIFEKYPDGDFMRHEPDIEKVIAETVGNENIYNFQLDFRMGQIECARQLDEFIESVLEYTGKDKVNIYAVSHGGQTTSTYITLYGWKNRIHNAIMTIPAIGGAGLAYEPLTNTVSLNEECLARFIEHGTMTEADIEWLLKANQLGFLDDMIKEMVPYLFDVVGYWGSMWDFLSVDVYEDVKKDILDPVASADLIAKSDEYHYEVQPLIREKFAECQANGANISILAGTGNPIVTGSLENSDGIITVACSTGATVAPYGQRFADGYTQVNPCGGKYKVSPKMDIDASTAYLPNNTWFVEGLFHGMTLWDYYTIDLAMKLLLTDDLKDVYSDPAYPQFKYSTNPSNTVYAEFNSGKPGYPDGNATALRITNVNRKNPVTVTAVVCDGIDLKFKVNPLKILKPGETVEIPFEGKIPEISKKEIYVTVCFVTSTISPAGYRTQGFTVMNGSDTADEGGFRDAVKVTPFDTLIGDNFSGFLEKLGIKEFLAMIYSVVYYWFNFIFG